MLVLSCVGICALFFLQYKLYKKEENKNAKSFMKSNSLLGVTKELLVVLLGVTLALNFTSIDEQQKTNDTVIKLLKVAQIDIENEYVANSHFLAEYEAGTIEAQIVRYNTQHNSSLIENVLENDTVMTTISPLMYSVLVNNLRNRDYFYEEFCKVDTSDEYMIKMASAMNEHTEFILWALDAEIKHLQGIYSDRELEDLYTEFFNCKYKRIDTP